MRQKINTPNRKLEQPEIFFDLEHFSISQKDKEKALNRIRKLNSYKYKLSFGSIYDDF